VKLIKLFCGKAPGQAISVAARDLAEAHDGALTL